MKLSRIFSDLELKLGFVVKWNAKEKVRLQMLKVRFTDSGVEDIIEEG